MARRYTRTLPDDPSDARLTDLSRPLSPTRQDFLIDPFVNRNLTATTPYVLLANAATRALPRNPRRVGLVIQNKDTTADMFYSFGNNLDGNGLLIAPRSSVLFDFTTPADELYLFSAFNIYTLVMEITRGFAPPMRRK